MVSASLPFGKHKGQSLDMIPNSYLRWLLTSCKLSSGLRSAVAGELTRRGIEPPPPPEPPAVPCCRRCRDRRLPDAGHICTWLQDRAGNRRVRASCCRCFAFLTFLPCREPFTTMADAFGSSTDLLDVLIAAEELGLELYSDGRSCRLAGDEWKAPLRLRALIQSCSHELAGLLGPTGRHCGHGTGSTERSDVDESDRD